MLNPFLELGRDAWSQVRERLPGLLGDRVPLSSVEVRLPVAIGDYVDFYSSIEHATNVGRIFRPDAEPLLPNWRHLPVGYHGRAEHGGGVGDAGAAPARPAPAEPAARRASGRREQLDVELELGFVTGPGALGTAIAGEARERIFGFVLVNDWSARDIQALGVPRRWGRSWPSRSPPRSRRGSCRWRRWSRTASPAPAQDPEPLPYLRTDEDWALDIDLEIALVAAGRGDRGLAHERARALLERRRSSSPTRPSTAPRRAPGDLYALGTISGPAPGTPAAARAHLGRRATRSSWAAAQHAHVPRGRRRGDPARARRTGLARRGPGQDPVRLSARRAKTRSNGEYGPRARG